MTERPVSSPGPAEPAACAQAGWITTPITAGLLRGAIDLEHTENGILPHRLPARARALSTDTALTTAAAQPSGVRLVVRTRATALKLDVLRTKLVYDDAPDRPDGVYDLFVDGRPAGATTVDGGNVRTVDMATGATRTRTGPVATAAFTGLGGAMKDVEIWLPHNEIAELVALRSDAPVEAVPQPRGRVWLHHGSSISHGSDAASPTTTWPAVAAYRGGAELINFGLGGSALLDAFTARTIRDTPADLISIKIGINLVNADVMRMRAFTPAVHGFLDTIREGGHPTTELLVVSPILCPIHEDTPGPTVPDLTGTSQGRIRFQAAGTPAGNADGRLTLNAIRAELARIVQQRSAEDPHLHYLDGRELYGEADAAELPMPDRLHPDPAGHRRIGERFADLVFGPGGPFAATEPAAATGGR
ncbi:SGNH/GDSL hydrolase family protein [Streptomonospora sediminis]